MPQKTIVSFDYSVKDFVVMRRTSYMNVLATLTKEDYEKAEEALRELEITDLSDRLISELSGGDQQKVCIARALVQTPKLIIFDEPTSAFDFGNQLKVLKHVKRLSESGYAILLTTHNPDLCLMLGGDEAILERKGNLKCGSCDDILNEKCLLDAYNVDLKFAYMEEVKRSICVPKGL